MSIQSLYVSLHQVRNPIKKLEIMANMAHCRFENTFNDLNDCFEVLRDQGSVEATEIECNQYDKKYVRSLVELCKDIVDEFGEDIIED